MVRIHILLVLGLVLGVATPAVADGGLLSSDTRTKIHRAKLRSSMIKSESRSKDEPALDPCQTGNVDIGSIQVERGARVPNEVTVVVDGDVINLNDGTGTHVCR